LREVAIFRFVDSGEEFGTTSEHLRKKIGVSVALSDG
jgi:hypothetical protein